jgi:hypothetical protein
MAGCSGQWYSTVNGQDDGILDLSNEIHAHDNQFEHFVSLCLGRKIFIQKLFFHYSGTLGNDGMYHGTKFVNPHLGTLDRGPFDEPPAGAWTAQGPIIEGKLEKVKSRKAPRGTKKAAQRPGKVAAKK